MAVSGNQKTSLGFANASVSKTRTISAKVEYVVTKFIEGKRVLLVKYNNLWYTDDTL